jgi:hypothetical protein
MGKWDPGRAGSCRAMQTHGRAGSGGDGARLCLAPGLALDSALKTSHSGTAVPCCAKWTLWAGASLEWGLLQCPATPFLTLPLPPAVT